MFDKTHYTRHMNSSVPITNFKSETHGIRWPLATNVEKVVVAVEEVVVAVEEVVAAVEEVDLNRQVRPLSRLTARRRQRRRPRGLLPPTVRWS